MVEEELRRLPSKGWAAMIRKVYEVDPMICSKCGGRMKVVIEEKANSFLSFILRGIIFSWSVGKSTMEFFS
ncbi:MAG: hypothetical protein A2V76_08985 [Candidatus Aminicenantes bacterium RBG_16_63_14]|nr:MAG: hypothetical protein A2V76_08985 [Candidatus Aminicenantes bacterium RBG_16_63_14]